MTLVMEMFAVVLVDARCWYGGGRRPIVGEWRDNTDWGDVSFQLPHTHTLSIDTVLRVSVKSQFPQGLADTFPGEAEESGERMKNEAKEESGGEESAEEAVDGNLEASTMTTTTSLPQAQKLQQPLTTSDTSKNKAYLIFVIFSPRALFLAKFFSTQ